MPANPANQPAQKDNLSGLRGVIDQIEGDFAVVVFDDEQRLDWPRRYLPENARPGDAVLVRVTRPDKDSLPGECDTSGQIAIAQNQSLRWPTPLAAGPVSLAIEVDAEDTAARKARVRSLLNDIFKRRD